MTRRKLITGLFWLVILAAAIWNGWVFYSRYATDQRQKEEAAKKQKEAARFAFEAMGGDRFDILQFYASPGLIRRGESAQLCYGVSRARTVRIEPPVGNTWPSLSRCLDIRPVRDTKYTLTIEDAAGNTKSAELTVQVR
jgi:hypothetical protein